MSLFGFGKTKQRPLPPKPKQITKDEALSEFDLRKRKNNALGILTQGTFSAGTKLGQ